VTDLTLHDYELDDDCYKVRLFLSLLQLPYAKVAVDAYPGREQQTSRYLKLNPLGLLPILTDGDLVLCEAEAILGYLARKYDGRNIWLPAEAALLGQALQWLAFANGPLKAASSARRRAMLEEAGIDDSAPRTARHAFRIMEDHITKCEFGGSGWFVGSAATVADIAMFPAIALSRDFGIDYDEFAALRRWMGRVRILPGFITMPGIPAFY
jgi:glutathione S-transferase